jgi:hypothetical protein
LKNPFSAHVRWGEHGAPVQNQDRGWGSKPLVLPIRLRRRSRLRNSGAMRFNRFPLLRKRASLLDLFGRLRDDRSCGLEAYFGMGSVAEWFIGRCAAATERNGGLASKIDLLTVGVNQLDRTFDAKRSVWSYRDGYFTFSHEHPSLEI